MSNWERDSQENNLIDWKIISCWWKGEKEVAASFHACKGLATVKTCHQPKDHMVSESKSQERKPRITKYLNWKDIRDTRELNWLAQGHTAMNGRVEPFIHMNDTRPETPECQALRLRRDRLSGELGPCLTGPQRIFLSWL